MEGKNDIRLTIDYPEDLSLFKILHEVYDGNIDLDYIYAHPEKFETLKTINAKPDISVYTCVKDGAKTLPRTIKSVLSQTDVDIEYIICDDGSTDSTRDILWQHINNPKVKIISNEKNKGLAFSSNKCLKEARGDYFIRVDADDEFTDNGCLKAMHDIIQRNHLSGICYTSYYENNPGINDAIHPPNKYHHAGCAIVSRKVFEEVKFNEDLRHWDGLDFYNRLIKYNTFNVVYDRRPLWIYHQSPMSMSKSEPEKRAEIKNIIGET